MSRTLLITGASRGIGFETARRFLAADNEVSRIVLLARDADALELSAARLGETNPHGKTIAHHAVDLADRSALVEALTRIHTDAGRIHLVVNNAGYTNPVAMQQIDFADFERTMAVNLYAPFTVVQELLHRGNRFDLVVNVASTAGIRGRPGWLTYSASKAALINMSHVMREELAIYGTRVVCVSPGRTATDLRRLLAPEEDPDTIMQPGSVAEVIEMLASPVGRFVDSDNIVVRQ
jgi:3-oxoacyl-[acyl-carrier protein] reductase